MTSEITLENVLKKCGDYHRYQFIHYILLNFITIISGVATYYYVFGFAEPTFHCQYSMNKTTFQLDQMVHNKESLLLPQCQDIDGSQCTKFVYDRSIFGRTFTEDAQFVCDRAMKKTWLSTLYQIGGFVVILTGWIGDKIGRKKLIQILDIGIFLVTLFIQLAIQFIGMSVETKFKLLLINQFVFGVDAYSMVFLLLMELTSSKHTGFAGNLAIVSFALGEILVTVFAYIARDWMYLRWLIVFYIFLILPYLYFVPESPYWLLSQKKYDQLEICLRKIAETNKRSDEQWHEDYKKLMERSQTITIKSKHSKTSHLKKILFYLPRLTISTLLSFVTMIVYFKISFGLATINGIVSPYWNTIIGAVVESIGYISASVLINTKLGRKYSLMLYFLTTSICVFIIPFLMQPYPVLTIILSQMAKLTISGALCIAWIYAPELFPTSIRGLANGIFVFAGRIGAILAPVFETKFTHQYSKMTLFIYSGLTLVTAGVLYFLSETRNRSFHDETEDDAFRNGINKHEQELHVVDEELKTLQNDTLHISNTYT